MKRKKLDSTWKKTYNNKEFIAYVYSNGYVYIYEGVTLNKKVATYNYFGDVDKAKIFLRREGWLAVIVY